MFPLFYLQSDLCSPPSKCVDNEQVAGIVRALEELRDIKDSPAKVEFQQEIVIIEDWEGRIYINGGSKSPIKLKLTIGQYLDRDMQVDIPIRVHYREKPPDPFFRLRLRAQAGVLLPQIFDWPSSGKFQGLDAGLGLDFMHLGPVNTSVNLGVFSSGVSLGLDLTKNFGVHAGPAIVYDRLKMGAFVGLYFSFN